MGFANLLYYLLLLMLYSITSLPDFGSSDNTEPLKASKRQPDVVQSLLIAIH